MGEFFVCPICGNSDEKKIGYINGKAYCRACITFKGQCVSYEEKESDESEFSISYELSKEQKDISSKLLTNFKEGNDSLLIAVCGAGKTEIVFETISHVLKHHGRVGFAIPRRDVVIEISKRLIEVFNKNSVVAVYGGNTNLLKADIICLTTHQLFRYECYFDLLIVDEIDAFPFNGNNVLFSIMKRSIKGNLILMSATPSEDILNRFEENSIFRLNTRFHKHPLPVPQVIKKYSIFKYNFLLKKIKEFLAKNKPLFIFCPTIEQAINTFKIINLFIKGGNIVHSKVENRKEIIEDFRNGKYKFLVTTAILERGVTVKDLQVIIFNADHALYDSHALIQISGRVGRKVDAPEGEVIFIVEHENIEIEKCIKQISRANKDLC